MTGTHLNWSPCTGCACPNHHLPSHDFPPDRHTLNDPNLARLTRSNDEPMEGEIATLRGMISTYEAEIQDINKEESRLEQFISDMKNHISLAQQKLDALCHERNHIAVAITERKGLLHPIRRLPAEILLRIFRLTIDFPISRSHTKGDNQWEFHPSDNMLWSIERVCKRWMTGSLSFPELWSFVNVVITDSNFGEDPRGIAYVRRLGMQLARSKLHRFRFRFGMIPDTHRSTVYPQPWQPFYSPFPVAWNVSISISIPSCSQKSHHYICLCLH